MKERRKKEEKKKKKPKIDFFAIINSIPRMQSYIVPARVMYLYTCVCILIIATRSLETMKVIISCGIFYCMPIYSGSSISFIPDKKNYVFSIRRK